MLRRKRDVQECEARRVLARARRRRRGRDGQRLGALAARDELAEADGRAYAKAIYKDDEATLSDLREAVATLEDAGRIARRVMGGAHPMTVEIEDDLQEARAALNAELRAAFKEGPSSLSANDRARAEQLLARDARKAAKKAARA